MMTTTDVDRLLDAWLGQDEAGPAPRDVVTAAFTSARTRRQHRRSGPIGWAVPRTSSLRLALLLGLLVAVALAAAALVGALPSPPRTYSGVFTPTASMSAGRSGHTATLLKDGRVLISGGWNQNDGGPETQSAELYDPRTERFSDTGPRTTSSIGPPYEGSIATLLPDGRVLVLDGSGSAELYDPTTGTFRSTGSMTMARPGATATLLRNGSVLVTGGSVTNDYLGFTTAELYDPATGMFTPTGSMITSHYPAAATLLTDGRVLVTGGEDPVTTAELYDPATGRFSPAGSVTKNRFSATLLQDGRVLVAGNSHEREIATAELYDPATGMFTPTGSMIVGRGEEYTATLLQDGSVLVAGTYRGEPLSGYPPAADQPTAGLYDPATGIFTPAGSMIEVSHPHTATLLQDGRVLIAGGWQASDAIASAELFH